ncbi:putative 4-coumarate--CoA ligase-like 7 [Sesbania bispinosa]|nr:putative 4-coumarate--CoA ligase-like 7 [Sesbania bispinosa]
MIGRCLSLRQPFSGCSVVKQLAGGAAPLEKDVMQGCAKILPHAEIIQKMQRKDAASQVHHLKHRNTSSVVLGTTRGHSTQLEEIKKTYRRIIAFPEGTCRDLHLSALGPQVLT